MSERPRPPSLGSGGTERAARGGPGTVSKTPVSRRSPPRAAREDEGDRRKGLTKDRTCAMIDTMDFCVKGTGF